MTLRRWPWPEIFGLIVVAAFVVPGATRVPFHPDETSWLYQSRDLELLFTSPGSMAWRADAPSSPELTYRLLNAPLAKYVLGLARLTAGFPASSVAVDWDWSLSWEANLAAAAMPPPGVLDADRVASALLLLLAVVALYFAGRALGGRTTGFLAAILLATNALVLLHGRRAMAEGALTMAVSLALLGLLYADRHPWLAGAAAGLAFAAKTSAAVWIPLGWIGAAWAGGSGPRRPRTSLARMAAFTAAAGVVVLLLYPVLWQEPLGAIAAMYRERQALVASQVETFGRAMPWAVLSTPGERLVAMLAHLFVAPPQFAEASNYAVQTAASEAAYLRIPGVDLLRGFAGGAVVFGLTMLGMALAIWNDWRTGAEPRRRVALALLATGLQGAVLLAAVPLSFQRYVLPMIPLACLWAGHGAARLLGAANRSRRTPSDPAAKASA